MSTTKSRSIYYSARGTTMETLSNGFTQWGKVIFLQRTAIGNSLPKWKDIIRRRDNATTAFSGTYESLNVSGMIDTSLSYRYDPVLGYGAPTIQHEYVKGDLSSTSAQALGTMTNSSWDSDVKGRAANKFLSEVRKATTSMSAPTFLGELHQTLRMLRHPMEALGQSCDRYYKELSKRKLDEQRRRRRKGLPELPKDSPKWEWLYAVPGLWLEYSFGWSPLMMDINDALDTLDHLSDRTEVRHISKGAMGAKVIANQTGTYAPPGVLRTRCNYSDVLTEQTMVRYRGDVVAQAATTYAEKGARWGFTPSEFVPTAWELLPWSFLVDYFASIGDYLDSRFADTTDLKWCAETTRKTRLRKRYMQPSRELSTASLPAAASATMDTGGPCQSILKRTTVSRVPGVIPSPAITFTFLDQSSKHLANMSALLGMFSVNLHSQRPPTAFAFRR